MAMQLSLNFKERISSEKKTARVTIPCSDSFINLLDELAKKYGTDRAKLAFQFVVEGMQKSIGNVFMAELRGDEKLSDLFK